MSQYFLYQHPDRRNSSSTQCLFFSFSVRRIPSLCSAFSFPFQCLLPCLLEEGHIEDSGGPTACHTQVELGGNGELHPHRILLGLLALLASQGMLLKHSSAQQLSGTTPCPWELDQGAQLQLTQPQCCTFPFCQVITANPTYLLYSDAALS